jgi:hypothetical protein
LRPSEEARRDASVSLGSYSPHRVAIIVGHQQPSAAVDDDADRTAASFAVGAQQSGEHFHRLASRFPVLERDEDDALAARRPSVLRTMLPDEHAAAEAGTQRAAVGVGEAERCGVRAERVVGRGRAREEIGPRRLD